jgi:hypothetical protein
MDTFKDVFLSIRDWFKDRVGNPFFASFLVAWLILNWRVVLVLFSDMTALDKITWLDTRLYPERWHWTYYGLVTPLATAALYVALSPHILRKVSVYCRKEQHKSTGAILQADGIQPISPDLAQRLIQERITARLNLKKERTRFAELETDYLDQIENLQKQLNPKQTNNESKNQSDQSTELHPKSFLREAAENLSVKATEILDAACNAGGFIEYRQFLNGKLLKAGDKNLLPPNVTSREVAEWEAAIDELKDKAVIQDNGIHSYKVTKRGYDIHDVLLSMRLKNQEINGAPLGGAAL